MVSVHRRMIPRADRGSLSRGRLQGNGATPRWPATLPRWRMPRHAREPVAQRPPHITALEHEPHRIEEVLVAAAIAAGQPVHRSPSALPAAVLGVRIADKVLRAA